MFVCHQCGHTVPPMSRRTWKGAPGRRSVREVVRPPKPQSQIKTRVIKIRVTAEQEQAFKAAAEREGMDLSVFVRIAVIEKARRAGVKI